MNGACECRGSEFRAASRLFFGTTARADLKAGYDSKGNAWEGHHFSLFSCSARNASMTSAVIIAQAWLPAIFLCTEDPTFPGAQTSEPTWGTGRKKWPMPSKDSSNASNVPKEPP